MKSRFPYSFIYPSHPVKEVELVMLPLGPNPRNRLYTSLYSYLQFLGFWLEQRRAPGRKSAQSEADIERFQHKLSQRFDTKYALCVYQCRLGIYLAIKSLIKPGQEVILSPYTIADVIHMVIFAGGRPVFADIDRETCNISADEVARLIHANTGAVLITHLHGMAAEAHRIKAICALYNVAMIEDCAQAFGVTEQDQPVGTIGDVGVFSFEMHKNIPTWLGGVVITNRANLAEQVQAAITSFSTPPLPGILSKVKAGLKHDIAGAPGLFQLITYPLLRYGYLHKWEFINKQTLRVPQESQTAQDLPDEYRSWYTPFQSRIGMAKLQTVDRDIEARIEYGRLYHEGLKDIDGLVLPPLRSDHSMTYLWYPLQCANRDALLKFMFEQGRDIAAGHFINHAKAPRFRPYFRDCPNATKVEQELIYLPTYPGYSRREVKKNIEVIRKYFELQKDCCSLQSLATL